jgi:beta-galactosidase
MRQTFSLIIALLTTAMVATAEAPVRTITRLDEGWKFAFGNASDPARDFGCGTEYFNYLTKANSIHNEGPYSMKFNDSLWQDVRIPHDFAAALPLDSRASHSHGYKTVGWRYPATSVGWYRKVIAIGEEELGKRITLRFDGIFRNAQVWFNGFWMGTEPSGYATQVYDVTDYVNYGGDNLICVRADATLEEGWFYEGGGIYRDVWLEKAPAIGVAPFGTFVRAVLKAPYDEAVIHIRTEVTNHTLEKQECTVYQQIIDAEGDTIVKHTQSPGRLHLAACDTRSVRSMMKISKPHLWDTDNPYLYQLETIVRAGGKTDRYVTTFGIRDVQFTADRGFLLNGRQVKLKGVNMHQDHAGVGAAIPDALQAWRIRQLKQWGCNAYRASHNPMTPALLDICDREGILVIEEQRLSGVNDEHLRQLENMIRRDRNHPCIILWSDGNEEWGMENAVNGRRVAEAMRAHTRLLDPTRHSTMANAGGVEMIKGLDVVGFNYIVQNDVDNRKNQHPDWKIVGSEETSGCGTRGVYFNQPDQPGRMVSMNRDTTHHHIENVIERGWQFYADRPWAAGLFYWTGFDYRGEPNPLSYPATLSEFGLLDYCGFPKDEAWYLRAWWTDEPVLHIFPHWNLAGHEGEEVEIWAYSNCDEVELWVNGKNMGRQTMPRNGHLKWKAVYQPGSLKAVGYKNGKRILTQKIETTDEARNILLTADRTSLQADGQDVAVITVSLSDKKKRLVPDACIDMELQVEGDARILGVGNGDPAWQGAENPGDKDCRAFRVRTFNGLAQVIVQSGKSAGPVSLTCSAPGLKPAVLQIETKE